MNELAKIESFRREIAIAETIEEVKLLSTEGELLAEMAKKLQIPIDGQNELGLTRIELEKKKRELIEIKFPKGRHNQYTAKFQSGTLQDFGITRKESFNAKIIKEEDGLVKEAINEIVKEKDIITPKKVAAIVRKKKKQNTIKIKEAEYKEKIKFIDDFNIDIYNTDKKFNIIYADPPWQYWEGGEKNQSLHYNTMTINEICNLPIKNISDENCILFLWVTYPILQECFKVISAWGFKYSTCGFIWIKKNKNSDTYFFGNGSWTRANSELCLIGIKGQITRLNASISQIIDDKIMKHSQKPEKIRNLIVDLVGELPRIELFSRNKNDKSGWFNWGNEI